MGITGPAQKERNLVENVDYSRDITKQCCFIAARRMGPLEAMRELKKCCTADYSIVADARELITSVGSSQTKGPIYREPLRRVGKYSIFVNTLRRKSLETHQ